MQPLDTLDIASCNGTIEYHVYGVLFVHVFGKSGDISAMGNSAISAKAMANVITVFMMHIPLYDYGVIIGQF